MREEISNEEIKIQGHYQRSCISPRRTAHDLCTAMMSIPLHLRGTIKHRPLSEPCTNLLAKIKVRRDGLPITQIKAGNCSYYINSYQPTEKVKELNARVVVLRHTVRRPGQIVCPNSDSVCRNSDKIYLTVVTFRFLLLFFAY